MVRRCRVQLNRSTSPSCVSSRDKAICLRPLSRMLFMTTPGLNILWWVLWICFIYPDWPLSKLIASWTFAISSLPIFRIRFDTATSRGMKDKALVLRSMALLQPEVLTTYTLWAPNLRVYTGRDGWALDLWAGWRQYHQKTYSASILKYMIPCFQKPIRWPTKGIRLPITGDSFWS